MSTRSEYPVLVDEKQTRRQLLDLYWRRDQLDRAIASLEQIRRLRTRLDLSSILPLMNTRVA